MMITSEEHRRLLYTSGNLYPALYQIVFSRPNGFYLTPLIGAANNFELSLSKDQIVSSNITILKETITYLQSKYNTYRFQIENIFNN